MRIALLLCVILGITCVTAQQAKIYSQLSTNQTLNLFWTCNFPYATATDDQGIVYSSCNGNNGSQGILWTYRDDQGQVQTGWVTSPENGSCYQSWGLSVSRDGEYVFATCYGNPQNMQIMGYQRTMNNNNNNNDTNMMNGNSSNNGNSSSSNSMWTYIPQPLNISKWACGRDIIFDSMTEDIYAICGQSLTSATQRIIRFPHNDTTDSYMMAQDLGIPANYIKYNPLNQYLYYSTTTMLGYLVIHNNDNTSISMPNNMTMIPVNGTLTNYCEITSFTFSYNTTTTLFVGCTGIRNLLQSYTSYSILRIDMNGTWLNMTNTPQNMTIIIGGNSTVNNNSTNDNSSMNSNSTSGGKMIWSYTAMNISWTDSKAQGGDDIQDLGYPADGSCKGPADMEVDSMNQLYVACMRNQDVRSVIRYTQINSTYYLPAYVTSPAQCSHPGSNSLTLTMKDDVIVSCYVNNMGFEFSNTMMNNTGNNNNTGMSSSTGGSSGMNNNGTTGGNSGSSSMGSSSGISGSSSSVLPPPTIPIFNGTSSGGSSTGRGSTGSSGTSNGTTGLSSSSSGRGGISSSSTGIVNGSMKIHIDITIFLVSLLLVLMVSV